MKLVTNLQDLKQFGINPLTGEADNLMFRILCDVDIAGYKVICEAYGLKQDISFLRTYAEGCRDSWPEGWAENWNSGGVASIMLDPHSILQIAIVGMLTEGNCHTALLTDQPSVFGLEGEEKWFRGEYDDDEGKYLKAPGLVTNPDAYPYWPNLSYGKVVRTIQGSSHPHQGTRNVHSFTGRTV